MPDNDMDLLDWFQFFQSAPGYSPNVQAVIEKVGGYVGFEQPGSRMFNFGMNYGKLLMALTCARIPYQIVTPQKWEGALGISPRKKKGRKYIEDKAHFKNRLRARAQQLFPTLRVWDRNKTEQLKVADAILLAYYCRSLHE
jgi:hypothetical protein